MIKSKHADLLNRLDRMQQSPYYATASGDLSLAEQTIVSLERQRDELLDALRRVSEVKDQSGMAVDLLTDIHFIVTDALSKAGAV